MTDLVKRLETLVRHGRDQGMKMDDVEDAAREIKHLRALVGDKRRSGSVDSAPLAQSIEPPLSTGDVQSEFYAWWEANQVDRLHGMIAQNCALAAWHDAYDRYVRRVRQ